MAVTDAVEAVRGGVGFLTRLPVGHTEQSWEQFRERPIVLVLVGYLVGALLVPVLALPLPAATVALAYVVAVYALTGINHLDGVADLGDAMAVHGDADRRREVMTDTTTGVGALLAVGLVLVGLALGGMAIAGAPVRAVGLVLAAEVAGKLGTAVVVCLGSAAFDGLGAELADRSGPGDLVGPAAVALPAVAVTWPGPAAGAAIAAGVLTALAVRWWANAHLGGVSGDVMGAANELSRVVALHVGVVTWMRF